MRMGTRGSRLAMAQARWVAARIAAGGRTSEPEPVVIRTRGDADSRPLFAIDQKGIF
ncbi:MAG: hydroxymethylbilane synthase, partial [Thaumarchaeota archaeon S15]